MAIKRRELIAGAVALAGMLWAGPAAFGNEINLGRIGQIKIRAAKLFTSGTSRILVFRRSVKRFSGFIATCPSDQVRLTAANVRGGRIICRGDSSVFSATTGARVSGPATSDLERVTLKITNGFLIASLGATAAPPSSADQLIESSKVPVGGGVKVESSAGVLMVIQPSKGKFAAYSAICTHAGCEVSRATARAIICTCHNSEFSTADGDVLSGPAGAPLKSFPLVERSGVLFLR